MDFTTIGTITSYLKQKNMKFAANYKIKTGQKVTDANGDLNFAKADTSDQVSMKKRSDGEVTANRLASIKQKLANGRKLSNEELSYLRAREPKTYKKAKHTEEAREELRGELKKAKTKQEARQAVTQAMIKASAQASADIADYKSNSKSSSATAMSTDTSLNSVNDDVDKLSGTVHSGFGKNLESIAENNFDDQENLNDFDATENDYSDSVFYFNQSNNSSKTSKNIQHSNESSPQEIMEEFIMTIRALEATWAEFTKSKEYEELPDNRREEEFLKAIGEDKHKKHYKELETPKAKNLNAATAYRTSMLFTTAQFIVSPEEKLLFS